MNQVADTKVHRNTTVTPRAHKPCYCTHSSAVQSVLQTKLRVGRSNDRFEKEADKIAGHVVMGDQKIESSSISRVVSSQQAQRLCSECEEELQRKPVEGACHTCESKVKIDQLRPQNNGSPLPVNLRQFFESRMDSDFSQVRIHKDNQSNQAARSIGARAYTLGKHITFGRDEFNPGTPRGKRLIAHELTHVVQQSGPSSLAQPETIQRDQDTTGQDVADDNIEEGTEQAPPDFGTPINEPGCPDTPTNIGKVNPAPDCPDPESDEELDGERFKFCMDSDVFINTERTKLREFSRRQPAMALFTIHGYSSVDGNAQYNMRLSCHRAKRAARELINDGVPSQQIDIAKRGETRRFGAASENRTVLIHIDTPAANIPDRELNSPQDVINAALDRIRGGQYRLAADAYLSRWTCGRMPNLREMVDRITIRVEGEGRFPINVDRQGTPLENVGRNEIVLSRETFETTDPVACAMARIIDMGSHFFTSSTRQVDIQGPNVHNSSLFLVELAGLSPCVTPAAVDPSDPTLVLMPARQWWRARTVDPLANEPLPSCAESPLPGPIGSPPIGASTALPPSFTVDHLGTSSGSGALNVRVGRGRVRAESPRGAFRFDATVSATGDPAEIARYEVGFLQTIMADQTEVEYVGGERVRLNLPLPIRDGPPRSFLPPPWFEPRVVQRFGPANTVNVFLSDSPSAAAPLEFTDPELRGRRRHPTDRGNILNRLRSDVTFHTWVAARRDDAPLTRFSTFFLDGGIVTWTLEADLIGDRGRGAYDAQIGPAAANTTGMQLSGPTPAEIGLLGPFATMTAVEPPLPRGRAGGLPLDQWRAEVRRIAGELEPLRRALNLEHRLMIRVRVDPETGRVELPFVDRVRENLTRTEAREYVEDLRDQGCIDLSAVQNDEGEITVRSSCPRPAVTIESLGGAEPSSGTAEQQYADAIFNRIRKFLVLAPASPDPANVRIPVVLTPIGGGRPDTGERSENPFAPEHGIGLVTEIAETAERVESQERFEANPTEYDPDFVPNINIHLSREYYDYDFRVPGMDIDTVCDDPSLRTEGCVTAISPGYEPTTRVRHLPQKMNGENINSPMGIDFISFPLRFVLFTPRENPGGYTYNHELHHMVTAHRMVQIYKTRLERRIRLRLMHMRRLAAQNPDLAHEILSEGAIKAMVMQESEPFNRFFIEEYRARQLAVHERESRLGGLPPARLPSDWDRPTPTGGRRGSYHRSDND